MPPSITSNLDATTAWCRFLLDDLDNQLDIATSEGLPADAGVMGVAHIAHGVKMAVKVGDYPAETVATWLRVVADCLDRGIAPPLLVWLAIEGNDDERTIH